MYDDFRKKIDSISGIYGDGNLFRYMRDDGTIENMSYADMYRIVRCMEKEFERIGLHRGERVALASVLSPGTVLTGLALAYAGITTVLLDASLPAEELKKLITFSDVRAIFADEPLYLQLRDSFGEQLDFFGLIRDEVLHPYGEEEITSLKAQKTLDPENDIIAIIFSSGTTGTMKGIKITYESIIKTQRILSRVAGKRERSKYLYVYPFNHIAGYSLCYVFMFIGCELGLIENMNATKLQKVLLEFEPHYFAFVPKVYEVMEQKIRAKIHEKGALVEGTINLLMSVCYFFRKNFGINLGWYLFKSIRNQAFGKNIFYLGGGGTSSKGSNARFYFSLGLYWSDVYAATETGVPIAITGIGDRIVVDTVGNVNKNPEIQIAIGKKDENGNGEILVKSELMMKGYFREPELTKMAFDENGYFKTGDLGYIDKKGNLHVTGRLKESIILQNGKKVSPGDVDNYYSERVPGYEIACRGIAVAKLQYDHIHLFIQDDEYDVQEKSRIKKAFHEVSVSAPSMYKLHRIHFVNKIERTSIGKVKRYLLTAEKESDPAENNSKNKLSQQERFIKIIKNHCSVDIITMDQSLTDDLGIASLRMYELFIALENEFHADIVSAGPSVCTVGELYDVVFSKHKKAVNNIDISKFPMQKTEKDRKRLILAMSFMQRLWKIEIKGLEHVKKDENYIICPNHECHFDGMFVFAALHKSNLVDLSKIGCMAKKEHLEHKITTDWLRMLGGIPVDRYGMSAPSIQRSIQCIKEGYTFLIHPEGTRTKDGTLGEFRPGAAKLAEETGRKILPVRIDGAYELYPYDRMRPKLFDWKHFRRYRITITFAEPISKDDRSEEELMAMVRDSIIKMESK